MHIVLKVFSLCQVYYVFNSEENLKGRSHIDSFKLRSKADNKMTAKKYVYITAAAAGAAQTAVGDNNKNNINVQITLR